MAPLTDSHSLGEVSQDHAARLAASEGLLARAETLQSEVQRFADHLAVLYSDYFQHMPTYMHTSFTSELRAEAESLQRAVRDLNRYGTLPRTHAIS
ncbi:hypothetical protein F5Y05DRAFT_368040 [Hypoxylon sp. FL0543]|nr:hypothetical protein F5Y05DRAFT_368040 [Hypoxylon sp. FL0543]